MGSESAIDEYERRYMDAERAIARERTPCHRSVHVLCAVLWALTLANVCLLGPQLVSMLLPVAPLLVLTMVVAWVAILVGLPLIWVCALRIRTTITASFVRVEGGLTGPKIPIDAILEARVGSASEVLFWRYGVRERGLVLRFSKGKGERTIFVQSERPEELMAAIAQARGVGGPRVGVEATPEAVEQEGSRALATPPPACYIRRLP
jgi:hypothetical protein